MRTTITLAASVAALALSITGTAAAQSDNATTVANFGHCQSTFPAAQEGFGPAVMFFSGQKAFFAHVPPGQIDNAESGSFACLPE